ncbi:methyltransferase domain-containing protein [Akkermansiaceae bacterium]|nr:methyltransferase domain-containing protein [Akkermansiaceae bacterium]
MTNQWNRIIYAFWAPIYDRMVALAPFGAARRRTIEALKLKAGQKVLLIGVGTGADLPLVPEGVEIAGIDLSDAMLSRARRTAGQLGKVADLRQGDARSLPFADRQFDAVILTLILSVVPEPRRCLAEALRVLRPGGHVAVFDKFLPAGKRRPSCLRRILNILTRVFGTDINRSFEEIAGGQKCEVLSDEPTTFSPSYRTILLCVPKASECSV